MAKVPSSDQFWISKNGFWKNPFVTCFLLRVPLQSISFIRNTKKQNRSSLSEFQIQHEMVRMISTKRPLPHLLQPTGLGENIPSLKLLELGFVTDIIRKKGLFMLMFYQLSNPQ